VGSPARWHIQAPAAGRRHRAVPLDLEEGANHGAMMEALRSAKFPHMPELLGFAGDATVESEPNGVTALQLVPPPGAAEAAIEALAAFHALPIREGLDWGCTPGDLYPPDELPLHRLGFTADERERAREPLLRTREALWASPFGLAHRNATAGNILLAGGQAWLTDFGKAGSGRRVDVAAFLRTGDRSGGRRRWPCLRTRARWEAPATVDQVDLLGILWGIEELLVLPRKLIESLGDDAATAHLKLSANRIDKGMRQTAGSSAIAAAIRAALWHP